MSDLPRVEAPPSRRSTYQTLSDVTNPATIKGTIAVLCGVALLVVPDLSVTIIELVAGLGLLAAGLYDLWHAVTGRAGSHRGSRWLALGRGLAGVAAGFLLVAARQETVALVLTILGLYLIGRGLLSIGSGVFSRDRTRRTSRLTIGAAGLALGVLLLAVPSSLAEGLIVGGAGLALVVGGILLAYGLRVGAPAASAVDVQSASVPEILWDWVRSSDIGGDRRERLAETLYFE